MLDLFEDQESHVAVSTTPAPVAMRSELACIAPRSKEIAPQASYVLPGGPNDVLVVPVSGGADSTALSILLREMFPEAKFKYVFSDTKAEPAELYASLDRLEVYLGQQIERLVPEKGLYELIEDQGGFLPNSSSRWCTRILKGQSIQKWMAELGEGKHIHMFVGIRQDESFRVALTLPNTTTHMPFIDLGWKRKDVFEKLRDTIGIPAFYSFKSRSGCQPCPFMRRSEIVGLYQYDPKGFEKGESYEKLSPVDIVRHQPAPDLSRETGLAKNWLWLPKPKREEGIDGRLGCKSTTLFGEIGIFIGAEFFWDAMPGLPPFVWRQRLVSYSRSLSGIKRQLNSRYQHLLATAEAHDMNEDQVRHQVDFGIFYVEAPASVFDPEGTGTGSYGWHQGESYRQHRHVMGWAERILTGHVLSEQAQRRESLREDTFAWEVCDGSVKALQKVEQPLGRVVGMTLYKATEPDIDDELDERFIACPMCSI